MGQRTASVKTIDEAQAWSGFEWHLDGWAPIKVGRWGLFDPCHLREEIHRKNIPL